jgi:hypothetical protein
MLSFPLPKGGDGRVDGTGSLGEGKTSPTTLTISMIITTPKKTGNPVIMTVRAETPRNCSECRPKIAQFKQSTHL